MTVPRSALLLPSAAARAATAAGKTGVRRIARLLLIVASFLGSFLLTDQVMILLAMDQTSANAAAAMVGLIVAAYVMFPTQI
jgi:hypothetical protein